MPSLLLCNPRWGFRLSPTQPFATLSPDRIQKICQKPNVPHGHPCSARNGTELLIASADCVLMPSGARSSAVPKQGQSCWGPETACLTETTHLRPASPPLWSGYGRADAN